MTTREKNLAIAVGAVAVVFVGYWGVGQYTQAKADLDKQIQNKTDELQAVTREKRLVYTERVDQWREFGSQTLSMDPNQVQTRLRNEMNRLANESGLKDTRGSIHRNIAELGKARGPKDFVRVLSGSLDADGQVAEIVRFLYRLHGRPYLVRLKSLTLMRPSTKAEKGVLHLQATLETPILPATKLVRQVIPSEPEVPEADEKPRTILTAFDGYHKPIVKRKIFQPYENVVVKAQNPNPANGSALQPEQATVDLRWATTPGEVIGYKVYFNEGGPNFKEKEPAGDLSKSQNSLRREGLKVATYYWRVDVVHEDWEGEEMTTKGEVWNFRVPPKPITPVVGPPPPVRPVDAEFTVARILSSPVSQYVVLEDRRNPNAPNPPERKVEIGQNLFDGKLIYLHPRGVVSEKAEPGKEPEWRFHPIGEQVERGMKRPDEFKKQHGDVYYELVKLKDQLTGITDRPAGGPKVGG